MGRNHWSSSHCRCNISKRQGYFGGRKNDRLIGKKPPNPVGTKEDNQDRKDFIIVESPKINLCSQCCIELFHSQSTLRPVVHRVMTLYSQSILRPVVRRITPFTIYIAARVISGRLHPTASSQAKSSCYYSSLLWRIFVAPSRPVDSD